MTACAETRQPATSAAEPTHGAGGRWLARGAGFLRKSLLRSLWILLALAVLVTLTVMRLRSNLHDALGPLGPRLSSIGVFDGIMEREFPDSPEDRVLVLNGQRIHLSTRVADSDVDEALNASMTNCPTGDELGQPVTSGGQGYAICLHPSQHLSGGPSVATRIQNFASTLDMSDLGSFEYTYAERHGERTALLTLRSTDDLDVEALVPMDGDAPGAELADFPRPPDGRRLLQSYQEGQPYRLTVFSRSSKSAVELQTWYRQHVDASIWEEADLERQAELNHVDLEEGHALVFWRKEDPTRFTLVNFDERPGDDDTPAGTTVAIAEAL